MPLDVGRVTHLLEQMHRSEDDAGDPIDVGKVLVTDGARGFTWEDAGETDAILRYDGAAEWFLDHGAVGATETIDLDDGNVHWITLDANCTLTFTGAVASIDGQAVHSGFLLYVEQNGTGGWDLTLPGSVVDGAALSASLDQTASILSRIVFTTPDGGTTWYGDVVGGSSLADHDHSASGAQGGATLSPATFNFPATNSPAQTANGQAVWDTDDDVLTVGTGAARRTIGYVASTTPLVESGSGAAGTSNETSRADHVHPAGAGGSAPPPALLASDHSTPFTFDEWLQNSEGTDVLWASE